MKGNLAANNIDQIRSEVKNLKYLKERNKKRYIKELDRLYDRYIEVDIPEIFKTQYNQMNIKGNELIKELKVAKKRKDIEGTVEVYIRYLKASLSDFEGRSNNLKKYITSFLFSSMLFMALTPQFYGFILPILFFLPIYLGLKGVKERTMTGFYMTMSVVPVAIMTAVTWIRYGINVRQDYTNALMSIINSGVSEKLARILIVAGPILGCCLLVFAIMQCYRGYKNRDLFI